MAHLSGKAGSVSIADLLLEDCEDIWQNGAKGVAAKETTIIKRGLASAKCTIAASPGTQAVIMFEDSISPTLDLQTYDHILCWAYSTPGSAAGDYHIGIGTGASGATPTTKVSIPVLVATTWKHCHCAVVASTPFSGTSAGSVVALWTWINGAQGDIIYLDDIRAAKVIDGIKSWSLDYTSDALDSSDFADVGVRSFIAGASGWSGSFEGYKDGVPISIGSQVVIELMESATITQMWIGDAIITAVHPSVSFDGIVSYSYDFQGTDALSIATA